MTALSTLHLDGVFSIRANNEASLHQRICLEAGHVIWHLLMGALEILHLIYRACWQRCPTDANLFLFVDAHYSQHMSK